MTVGELLLLIAMSTYFLVTNYWMVRYASYLRNLLERNQKND